MRSNTPLQDQATGIELQSPEYYQATDYRLVFCNLCGKQLYRTRYPLIGCSIVTCEVCELSYTQPRVKTHLLEHKLQSWAQIDTVDEQRLKIAYDPHTLKLYQSFLERIENKSKRPLQSAKLLDIGCSVGAFLSQAKEAGCQPYGLEVGQASAKFAREKKNLAVETGSIYTHDYEPEQFDIISMMEVIEHIEDPLGALKRLQGWLKPGGSLFLTTPNFNSLYRRCHGTDWWVVNCEDEHIFFFTMQSLAKLLKLAGFEVTAVYTRGFDFAGIAKTYLKKSKQVLAKQNTQPKSRSIELPQTQSQGYFEARNTKEKWKQSLKKLGLLNWVRGGLKALDTLASTKGSPLYGLGEQLIIIARKP